jgi:predicted dinucleotide-binding enzyme
MGADGADRVGIIGAGKVGREIVHLARLAGYYVQVAGTGLRPHITEVDGVACSTLTGLVAESELIVLAVPIHRFPDLPVSQFAGRTVVDVMNYWPGSDGRRPEFEGPRTSSEVVSAALPETTPLVKTLNHFSYRDLGACARPPGDSTRVATALAADDEGAAMVVAQFVDRLGFDVVPIGPLSESGPMQPGGKLFGANLTANQMREAAALT